MCVFALVSVCDDLDVFVCVLACLCLGVCVVACVLVHMVACVPVR